MLFAFSHAHAQTPLVLGVHPYLQPAEIKKRFAPLAEYLSERLGEPVEVRVGQSYRAHLNAVAGNGTDIAFLGPALYVKLRREYGPRPLLARLEARHSPTFKGHIVVAEHSRLQTLADLRDKVFAFGDPESTASTLVPRALLQEAGIGLDDLASYRHYKGHANVALSVLAGDSDAGGVKEEIFLEYRDRGLRSLHASPPIPEHVFVAGNSLPLSKVEKIRELLQAITTPELIARVLKPIKGSATGLVAVQEADYQPLRQLIEGVTGQ